MSNETAGSRKAFIKPLREHHPERYPQFKQEHNRIRQTLVYYNVGRLFAPLSFGAKVSEL